MKKWKTHHWTHLVSLINYQGERKQTFCTWMLWKIWNLLLLKHLILWNDSCVSDEMYHIYRSWGWVGPNHLRSIPWIKNHEQPCQITQIIYLKQWEGSDMLRIVPLSITHSTEWYWMISSFATGMKCVVPPLIKKYKTKNRRQETQARSQPSKNFTSACDKPSCESSMLNTLWLKPCWGKSKIKHNRMFLVASFCI